MAKWIKWEGGECPVATGVLVEYRMGDGCIDVAESSFLNWSHKGMMWHDIVAYRIHAPDENPITHKALAKLHAKLDRIERKIDRLIARNDTDDFDINF